MMVKKTTLLTVNNVSKSVQPTGKEKRLVLNEINLRLYDNEVVSILGHPARVNPPCCACFPA